MTKNGCFLFATINIQVHSFLSRSTHNFLRLYSRRLNCPSSWNSGRSTCRSCSRSRWPKRWRLTRGRRKPEITWTFTTTTTMTTNLPTTPTPARSRRSGRFRNFCQYFFRGHNRTRPAGSAGYVSLNATFRHVTTTSTYYHVFDISCPSSHRPNIVRRNVCRRLVLVDSLRWKY